MKAINNITKFLVIILLFLTSCDDLFSPALENNRELDDMYNEPGYAQGILGYAYSMLPYQTKSETDIATDDAVTNDKAKVAWAKDPNVHIMYCDRLKGEAYGLRALNMYYLLMAHGGWTEDGKLLGIPNITTVDNMSTDFNVPRDTFQACIDQIFSDVEKATEYLPLDYNDISDANIPAKYKAIGVTNASDYNRVNGTHIRGRLTARIAEAIRAQAALLAASPAYNTGTTVTWANAADNAAIVLDQELFLKRFYGEGTKIIAPKIMQWGFRKRRVIILHRCMEVDV